MEIIGIMKGQMFPSPCGDKL